VVAAAACAAALLAGAAPAAALDDGQALTPPMGYNDWNAFGCDVSEALIEQTARVLHDSGLQADGYRYVNIDDCWMERSRDASGHLVADPAKFPDGIAGTAAYVHSLGLELGLYEDAGSETCAGYPGSLGHEATDARDFADWGVDYLKYDNCQNGGAPAFPRYAAMAAALKATGRPIVLSICDWGEQQPWLWGPSLGHLWRTTPDIADSWASMLAIVEANAPLAPYAGPGHWNDPDMLEVGNGGMSDTEYRSELSLWAIMAAPLLIGTDLRDASPATLAILGNRDAIAVDQDPLGLQGRVLTSAGGHWVLEKPLANGDVAIALFNATAVPATIATPLPGRRVARDLWSHATTAISGTLSATVPAHGTALFRVS
jgi:alpha-galactosidase